MEKIAPSYNILFTAKGNPVLQFRRDLSRFARLRAAGLFFDVLAGPIAKKTPLYQPNNVAAFVRKMVEIEAF